MYGKPKLFLYKKIKLVALFFEKETGAWKTWSSRKRPGNPFLTSPVSAGGWNSG
jgi:hypothetical protein